MPPVSEAQRRLMWAKVTEPKKVKGGPSRKAAKEFTQADRGGKLPDRKKDKAR